MMTEIALTTVTQLTPLTEHLIAAAKASAEPAPFRGMLALKHLDAPERETAALFSGAAVHDLGWLQRIAVRGEDRARWLSGMVTNTVEGLASQTGAYNLVLNAQGRIQGDLNVWRDGEDLELEIAADQSAALLAHLDRFIIMDDVELVPLEGVSALGLAGPLADQVLRALSLPPLPEPMSSASGMAQEANAVSGSTWTVPVHLRRIFTKLTPQYALWAKNADIPKLWDALRAAGAQPVGSAAFEALRVVEGFPRYGVDIQSRDLAQETAQTHALHFTKGCYLGQEIVERVRSRGQVHRHLRSLELTPASNAQQELPVAGTELRTKGAADDAKPAATLTSVTALQLHGVRRIYGLAIVRAEAEVGNRELVYEGGTAIILTAPPQLTFPADQSSAEETA